MTIHYEKCLTFILKLTFSIKGYCFVFEMLTFYSLFSEILCFGIGIVSENVYYLIEFCLNYLIVQIVGWLL